ncbi:peptidase [Rodentibacter pneumotropicus]|uniref:HK97 family phage prohead protease n=1 Tax=Rodentibacter pneumotropicus TaxID=758 RepID=UPI0009896CCD|nr:HK97 family phage prohead protease [Rodentibacter pneumotropicus]OOF68802.1 peptidase [Rodentibacter pneumotropicus]
MNKEFEIRSATLSTDKENQKLVGYVVRWNSPSEVLYCDFIEQFSPNAFTESLSGGDDVRALFEHDHTKLLGRTSAGTLKLEEDNIGLRFELTPPETTLGKDLLISVERGDISGMSFGFWAKEEIWDFDVEPYQRTVSKAELFEITVTSIPAYPESSVEIAKRSMNEAKAKTQSKPTALFKQWLDVVECE